VRLSIINTASQEMPRGAVLAAGRDPHPERPYVMSHPSFVLEWADGRMLLVDVGMTPEEAASFGKPLELLADAAPMQTLGSTAARLGADAARVRGVVFTHLHTDHVGGLAALCAAVGHELDVPMTEAQADRPNFTTRPGRKEVDTAGCARVTKLRGGGLMPLPGFPGVWVIAAGGHTPGSQIVLAAVRTGDGVRRYAFTGDTVNNIDGVLDDVPKPFVYRTFLVPESERRQQELRGYLKRLRDEAGFTLLVSHDQRALEASGVPSWAPRAQ